MNLPGIYCIKNIKNGKKYIGQTCNLENRKKVHFSKLRRNRHPNSYLQNSFNKYTENNFKFEILLICELKELTRYEQHFVDNDIKEKLYNIRLDCVNSNLGLKHSEKTKKKLSKIFSGRKLSNKTKNKMSKSKIGKKHPLYGKHLSKETIKKLSIANSGKNNPIYGKTGNEAPMFGKNHSDKTKEKISNSLIGHPVSQETKEKISKSHKGKNLSREHREKISKGLKNYYSKGINK